MAITHPLYTYSTKYLYLEGGARMAYVDEGAGGAVVMVHGNPTWGFYYRDLAAALLKRGASEGARASRGLEPAARQEAARQGSGCGGFRVIVPDHAGCGRSDKPGRYPYTLSRHIANFGALMDHLALERTSLVVHDWGGAIGLGWAVEHPERVEKIILLNTAAFFGPIPCRIRMCRPPLLGEILVRGLNGFLRGAFRMAVLRPLPREVRRGYKMPYRSYADRVAHLAFVRDIPLRRSQPSYAALQRIEAGLSRLANKPVLICWGMRDWCFTARDFLVRWEQIWPQAEVYRFEQAGHWILEGAGEEIGLLVKEFLG